MTTLPEQYSCASPDTYSSNKTNVTRRLPSWHWSLTAMTACFTILVLVLHFLLLSAAAQAHLQPLLTITLLSAITQVVSCLALGAILYKLRRGCALPVRFHTTLLLSTVPPILLSAGLLIATVSKLATQTQFTIGSATSPTMVVLLLLAWLVLLFCQIGLLASIYIYPNRFCRHQKVHATHPVLSASQVLPKFAATAIATNLPAVHSAPPSRPDTGITLQGNYSLEKSPPSSASRTITSLSDAAFSSKRSSFSVSTFHSPASLKNSHLSRHPSTARSHTSADPATSTVSRPPSRDADLGLGFDAWDTSELSAHMRESVLHQPRLKHANPLYPLLHSAATGSLPPIPGSRSPSPATALQGPFRHQDPSPPDTPLPQSIALAQIEQHSGAPHYPPFTGTRGIPRVPLSPTDYSSPLSLARTIAPPTLAFLSSPASSVINTPSPSSPAQSDIHPLFRSSSPGPPLLTSSKTVVTAAPEAGEFINRHTLLRMRSGSLPRVCSSPLSRSESTPNLKLKVLEEANERWETDIAENGSLALAYVQALEEEESTQARKKSLHRRQRSSSLDGCVGRLRQ